MVNVKKIIMRNFSLSTQKYDNFEEKYSFFKSLAQEMLKFGDVRDGKYLDAGCGTGILKEVSPRLNIVGLDVSDEMCRVAKKRIDEVFVGDAENLPFKEGVFDGVIFNASIFLIPNAKKAVEEALRVIKKGGVVLGSYIVGFFDDGGRILDRYGLVHREVYPAEKIDRFESEFNAEIMSVDYQANGEFMLDFYLIPAMSNALFPKIPYEERVKRIKSILVNLPEKLEFKCKIFKIHKNSTR
jgi:SAM-dependent methyltransferase